MKLKRKISPLDKKINNQLVEVKLYDLILMVRKAEHYKTIVELREVDEEWMWMNYKEQQYVSF